MTEVPRKLTVSGLVALLQEVVETNFVTVTVEGEISNFAAPASGHWYFTLKDSGSQLRGVMFRSRNRLVESPPRDGMQVVCSGTVTVYAARGEMQLVVDSLTCGGQGQLQAAFEALKERLVAEGLFAVERKQPLPTFPQSVGIVTSATGAAIHDILNIMQRRAPDVRLLLKPVRVQGDGAAEEIAKAIEELNQYGGLDVLIVGRGGGSLEDLWAFNEEVVARAIAASEVPVISAVGHETDFTIADMVADLRAPTPSAAAELVAKNRQELEAHLDHLIIRLQSRIDQSLSLVAERLTGFEGRLKLISRDFTDLPENIADLEQRLSLAMSARMRQYVDRLGMTAGRLDALSPLLQLDRGYVIASHEQGGSGLVSAEKLEPGDRLWLRFSHGQARTRVEDVDS
ncbi:MAG: exodeoxyribonuclease VII large subunit [Desulfuromonadales bacterium]|nr:exodeoxyribonuclease VII large subunit [Desulfuromonadales bacterium]